MTQERSDRIASLFEEVLAQPPEARDAFLADACSGDPALHEELRSLLAAHDAADAYFEDIAERIVTPVFSALADAEEQLATVGRVAKLQASLGDTYRVERELGGGGMSRVYLAEEVKLGRKVVIKVLPEEMGASVNAARFRREIQLSARLQHPHIVPVHTADVAEDLLYYTMPFVAGETLRARIERVGPLPLKDAIAIWQNILDALAYAHRNGVIHRDVKPENILLDGRNAVVADFGIARAVAAATDDVRSTATGIAIGTPAYMAPEQIACESDADHRVDLYAAGLVMYEMLAGQGPFAGLSTRELLLAHMTRAPAPLVRSDVPPALASLVVECLAKDRAARPESADAIVDRLERALDHPTVGTVTGAPTGGGAWLRRWRLPLIVGSALLVLVAVISVARQMTRSASVSLQGAHRPSDVDPRSTDPRPSLAVLPLESLTSDSLSEYLADVLTAALIDRFTQAGDLRVIQGPSAFFFKGHRTAPARIADSLGVTNVLSGAVHHEGSAVRVLLRLNSGAEGALRWTHTYKGQRENVFALEDSIGGSVARELLPHLAAQRTRRRQSTPDPKAYELYRRGRYAESQRERYATMRSAINYFSQAVARDSNFAEAYAALAECYGYLATGFLSDFPLRKAADSARYFAERALALDDSLPEAYDARAFVRFIYDFDWAGVEADVRKAEEISPYHIKTLQPMAPLYQWRGDYTRSISEMRLNLASDPMSPSTRAELGRMMFSNRDYDGALAQLDTVRSLSGGQIPPRMHFTLGEIHLKQRRFREAIADFEAFLQGAPNAPTPVAFLSFTYAASGDRAHATALLNELTARWRAGRAGALNVAIAYAGLRDYDTAFAWLDRAVTDRSLRALLMDPTFDELRRDPRFDVLLRRIGLRT